MSERIDELRREMEAAADAGDFERAANLRDRISLARSTGSDPDAIDPGGLFRQQPGAMGIGSSQAKPSRPEGWTPPKKPDPMTANTSRPKRPRRR